nr:PDZ domain-containing protein [uncultured Sediminibacterium sp.]
MFQKITTLFTLSLLVVLVHAQKISYKVSFPNAIHHEAVISITATGIQQKPAIFRMSRSSPGRYATHEFGKNIYDVKATDKNGNKIALQRIDGDVYEVPSHNGTVTVTYTLFANHADGTYAGIDPESIHFNMPATFMWIKGYDKAPIEISFDLPKENKGVIATQLFPTSNAHTFTAPGLQYFMDSPTKIGDLIIREWQVSNPDGKKYTIRIALEANATQEQADDLMERTKKIVAEAKAVFGEFPNYETGTYTFIMSANPYIQGDGMEHRNSTMISSPTSTFNPAFLQGVTSHEFFHNWNVERIRPKTLEPFNFEKSNMSNELWFAEGFTQYYGELLLARAGLSTPQRFIGTAGSLANAKSNNPGAVYYSPVDASNHAVFVDAGVSIDKSNYGNMFTSYYTYGAALALALDLELQTKTNKSLDDYMKAMWLTYGKTEIPYTIPAMQKTLASITNAAFAEQFFSKYITGHEAVDYAGLFAKAGYELKKSNEGKASIGLNTRANEQGKLIVSSNTSRGSSAYEAGLDINDEILMLDQTPVKSPGDINNYIAQKKPGESINVVYKHRGKEKQTTLVLKENTSLSLTDIENSGKTLTDSMKKIRDSWFKSKAQ